MPFTFRLWFFFPTNDIVRLLAQRTSVSHVCSTNLGWNEKKPLLLKRYRVAVLIKLPAERQMGEQEVVSENNKEVTVPSLTFERPVREIFTLGS